MKERMQLSSVITDQMVELPYRRIAIVREKGADLETPLSVYLKLRGQGASFLLESVSGGEQVARFSFIGVWPKRAFVFQNHAWHVHSPAGVEQLPLKDSENPFDQLRQILRPTAEPGRHYLEHPLRFLGGLVGYLSYDFVRYFEPTVNIMPRSDLPEAIFLEVNSFVAFDHAFGKLMLISVAEGEEQAIEEARRRLDALEDRLQKPMKEDTQEVGMFSGQRLHLHQSRSL